MITLYAIRICNPVDFFHCLLKIDLYLTYLPVNARKCPISFKSSKLAVCQNLCWLETSLLSFLLGMERAWEVVFVDELWERIKASSDIIFNMKKAPDVSQSW